VGEAAALVRVGEDMNRWNPKCLWNVGNFVAAR
jgi:hypothetical protein